MPGQAYDWTCSVCSSTWVIQATGTAYTDMDIYDARYAVGERMGYPSCVNPTYGCMSAQCAIDVLESYGLKVRAEFVTFDQAWTVMSNTTGLINLQGMYHFMGCRGVTSDSLWVANSAQGYRGVYDHLTRSQFNSLGPVQLFAILP